MRSSNGFCLALAAAAVAWAAADAAAAASNASLGSNDPTRGNVGGIGSGEFGLGHAPDPVSPFVYGDDANVIRMMNAPRTVGDGFYNGTLRIESDATVDFQHGGAWTASGGREVRRRPEGLTVMGDLVCAADCLAVTFDSVVPGAESSRARRYDDLNYVYVDGTISMGGAQFKMGTDSVNPVNVYAGSVLADSGRDAFANWSGDVHLYDPQGVSKFTVGKSGPSLVPFVSDDIERPNAPGNYLGGNVFCNNKELTIVGCGSDSIVSIGGDVVMSNPQGHLIVDLSAGKQSLVVGGSVVCAGRLTVKIANGHDFKAVGGIYVDPTKVTFDVVNGKINDVDYDRENVAAFVRENFAKGFVVHPETVYGGVVRTLSHEDPGTGEAGTYRNTPTYAYIQSLGVEASGTTNYDDTFKRIRTNARAMGYPKVMAEDGYWGSRYLADLASKIGNGYENYDYSLFPYGSRWDQIFEKYVRWDVSVGDDGAYGSDNYMKESEAAGHVYGDCRPVEGGGAFRACPPAEPDLSFIPVRVYGAGDLRAGVDYFNSKSHFAPYPESYAWPSIAYKEVTIGTHKGDGSYDTPKKSFYVIEDSCVINLADINTNSDENKKRFNIFVNPQGKSTPINVVFRGQAGGAERVNLVINNTVKYDVSGGSFDYANASHDRTYTKLKANPGREQVRIFFEKNGGGTTGADKFAICCTGAYGQLAEGEIHAIGSPYYPGTSDYVAAYGDIDSVTPTGSDAYAHELIPNVRVYAEAGAVLQCVNRFFANAELLMPEGTIVTGTNDDQVKVYFKEFPHSEEIAVERKYLFVLGSSCVQNLVANDAQGAVVCLEDRFAGDPVAGCAVTVVGGSTATPMAADGETVEIVADDPEPGRAFVEWTVDEDSGVVLADRAASTTSFRMPANDVTVTAVFAEIRIEGLDPDGYPWTGAAVEPDVRVSLDGVDLELVRGTDYTVSFTNNVAPGTATLVVTMASPRTGSRSATFAILPPPVVSNVVARQRWPWNGLVDVDYEVGGWTTSLVARISFEERGGAGRTWVATNFLAGAEPSADPGPHRATWDTNAAGVTNVVAAEVTAKVELVREPPVSDGNVWSLIGDFNSWGGDVDMTLTDGKWVSPVTKITAGGFKIRYNHDWTGNVGGVMVALGTPFAAIVGGDNISIEEGNDYVVTYDPEAQTILVEVIGWGVVGTINSWGGSADLAMKEENGMFVRKNVTLTADDEIKVRYCNSWDVNYGGRTDVGFVVEAISGSDNLKPGAGTYDIWLDAEKKALFVMKAGEAPKYWGVVGTINGWGGTPDAVMYHDAEGYFVAKGIALAADDEIKIRKNSDWTDNRGASDAAPDTALDAVAGGDNIKVAAGTYDVYYQSASEKIYVMTAGKTPADAQ